MKPDNIIIEAVTGSKAYGLDTKDSDEDIKGVYIAPTSEVLGIFPVRETHDHTDPDWSYHEVGKFVNLCIKGNPSIIEMLYLDGYRVLEKHGKMLVDNRHLFLSNIVYKSYGGYAISQARKLNARGESFSSATKNRYSKHARHCFRLLWQGKELLETGNLTVRVTPEQREELFAIGELPVSDLVDKFEREFAEFDKIKSVLPDEPNKERINELLLKIRKGN